MAILIILSISIYLGLLLFFVQINEAQRLTFDREILKGLGIYTFILLSYAGLFFVLTMNTHFLSPFPDGRYAKLESEMLIIQTVQNNDIQSHALPLTAITFHESSKGSVPQVIFEGDSAIEKGKTPYSIYLPTDDYASLIYEANTRVK